ncbi:MAG: U32 family peptidase [Elusimicrobiota bacterium]
MIKILAPINNPSETERLIKAGADELYCGVFHENWTKIIGAVPNAKVSKWASLKSFKELREITGIAGKYNVPVYLCLNAHYTTRPVFELAKKDYKEAVQNNVSGFIAAHLPLIKEIKKEYENIPVILSTMGNCFNSDTAAFYRKYGISRVVFPRYMTIEELGTVCSEIKRKDINIELEAFILNFVCRNINGLCLMHGPFAQFYMGQDRSILKKALKNIFSIFPKSYKYIFPIINKFIIKQKAKYPCMQRFEAGFYSETGEEEICPSYFLGNKYFNICAACALACYEEMGINHVKIVGRGYHLNRKLKDISFIKELRDDLISGRYDNNEFMHRGQESFYRNYGYRCRAAECHYPELIRRKNSNKK